MTEKPRDDYVRKLTLSSVLAALALAISPFLWFQWGSTRAFPGQHLVNVLAGTLLGPIWAVFIATIVGTLRILLGVGTVFAYPGGLPGGLVVGLSYQGLRRLMSRRKALAVASLTEPIGTVLLGGTLSWYIIDPAVGDLMHARFPAVLPFYFGWALSSVSGCLVGMASILALERVSVFDRFVDRKR